jgi:hypothetical protein
MSYKKIILKYFAETNPCELHIDHLSKYTYFDSWYFLMEIYYDFYFSTAKQLTNYMRIVSFNYSLTLTWIEYMWTIASAFDGQKF